MLFLIIASLFFFTSHAGILDVEKIYELNREISVFNGTSYTGSYILDLTNKELDSLSGISKIKVKYKDFVVPVVTVKRLYLKVSHNKLKELPEEITKLQLVAIELINNKDITISYKIKKSMEKCYFYLKQEDLFN